MELEILDFLSSSEFCDNINEISSDGQMTKKSRTETKEENLNFAQFVGGCINNSGRALILQQTINKRFDLLLIPGVISRLVTSGDFETLSDLAHEVFTHDFCVVDKTLHLTFNGSQNFVNQLMMVSTHIPDFVISVKNISIEENTIIAKIDGSGTRVFLPNVEVIKPHFKNVALVQKVDELISARKPFFHKMKAIWKFTLNDSGTRFQSLGVKLELLNVPQTNELSLDFPSNNVAFARNTKKKKN